MISKEDYFSRNLSLFSNKIFLVYQWTDKYGADSWAIRLRERKRKKETRRIELTIFLGTIMLA